MCHVLETKILFYHCCWFTCFLLTRAPIKHSIFHSCFVVGSDQDGSGDNQKLSVTTVLGSSGSGVNSHIQRIIAKRRDTFAELRPYLHSPIAKSSKSWIQMQCKCELWIDAKQLESWIMLLLSKIENNALYWSNTLEYCVNLQLTDYARNVYILFLAVQCDTISDKQYCQCRAHARTWLLTCFVFDEVFNSQLQNLLGWMHWHHGHVFRTTIGRIDCARISMVLMQGCSLSH